VYYLVWGSVVKCGNIFKNQEDYGRENKRGLGECVRRPKHEFYRGVNPKVIRRVL
jgi:uncharacterized C2H2 Zn-finger protein